MTCDPSVGSHSAWALLVLGLAALAVAVGRWRENRAQRLSEFERIVRELDTLPAHDGVGLRRNRLRIRTMQQKIDTTQYALDFEKKDPELAVTLRTLALQLAGRRGEITTDDIWEALDPTTRVKVEKSPKVMAAAFLPRKQWQKLPHRRQSARKVNHGRELSVWQLRQAVAA